MSFQILIPGSASKSWSDGSTLHPELFVFYLRGDRNFVGSSASDQPFKELFDDAKIEDK